LTQKERQKPNEPKQKRSVSFWNGQSHS
jgi:hypothetical protein